MLDSSAYLLRYVTLPHSAGRYMKYRVSNLMAFRTSNKNFSFLFCNTICICAALRLKMAEHSNNNLKVNLPLCL